MSDQPEMFELETSAARQAQEARERDHGGRLYGKRPQAPCDIGLFDRGLTMQRDLFG